jgi:hypothetical protein
MPYAKCFKLLRYRVNLKNRLGSLLPNLLDQIQYDTITITMKNLFWMKRSAPEQSLLRLLCEDCISRNRTDQTVENVCVPWLRV